MDVIENEHRRLKREGEWVRGWDRGGVEWSGVEWSGNTTCSGFS